MRIHTKETTRIEDMASPNHQQHPVQDASSKQQTKQKYKPIHQQTGLHLTQPCPSEEKQTNKQKLSTNLTLYEAYTDHWTNHRRTEIKRKKEFNIGAWEKETSDTISKIIIIRIIMKRQRNTTQMKEQTRNTEVQINENKIGQLPEKEFRIMLEKMIKNLENKTE